MTTRASRSDRGGAARGRGRRGTTLIELLVYLGLLTSGLTVIMGLELGAQRALSLQQALIDVEHDASNLLGSLRRDVEAARRLELDGHALAVVRHDGRQVRYEPGVRVETWEGGERRDAFARAGELRFTLEAGPDGPPVVIVEATFSQRGAFGLVHRSYRRSASPRGELGP